MTVLTSDVGRKTECPDCGHVFPIQKAEVKLEIPEPIVMEDSYDLKEASHDHDDARKKLSQSIMSQAEKELKEQAERKDLHKKTQGAFEERRKADSVDDDGERKPRESLTPEDYDPRADLVEFPVRFTPHEIRRDLMMFADVGLLMRWVFLSIFCGITLYLLVNAIYYASVDATTFGTWMACFASTAFAVVVGAVTMVFVGSNFLFLTMTISSGIDKFDWPELGIFDRAMEALFFVIAFFLGLLPFVIVYTIDPAIATPLAALEILAFPVFFLAMLAQGTVLMPWSGTILMSLVRIPGKWFAFYVATTLLWGVLAFAGYLLYFFAGIERLAYIALPGGVLLVGGLLVYAIWLGRVSWEIAELNSEIREEQEEENGSV